ncbi:MAG TPA: hypothetical protein VF677_09300 [Flavobacterium sp.]
MKIRTSGGKITVTVGGSFTTYAKGDIILNAGKTISITGKNGITFGSNPEAAPPFPVYENKIFTACIQFYRSIDHSFHRYGKDDPSYKGEFGFDKFDKDVCAEGLIGEYQPLTTVVPKDEPIRGVKKYLCPYLSVWPPGVDGNPGDKKSKVTLYVKAEKAITQLAASGEIEFTASHPNITINGSTTLKLTIDAPPQPLTIECKGILEKDETIMAKAKGENQILGQLIIKANAVRYKTIIQPVELNFGVAENLTIKSSNHTPFIQKLVEDFNTKSFNQAYIYGELAPQTQSIVLNKNEFEIAGFLSTKEDGKLYLKKDTEDDTSTKKYNEKIEGRYAASLSNLSVKNKAKEELQKKIVEVLTEFDKKFDFNKDKKGNMEYIFNRRKKNIVTNAWKDPNVKKAFAAYEEAKKRYDAFGTDAIALNKDKKLHLFYTNSIHAAKSPDAKVLAYSAIKSGVAHIFESALTSPDANTVILHELGHSLGLHHSFDSKNLGTYAIKENNKRYKDDVQKEIEALEGEITRLEQLKKDKTKSGNNENEIRTLNTLSIKYSSLQRAIDFKQTITPVEFESTFIFNLNLNDQSAIPLEANPLDNGSNGTSVSLEEIERQLNGAKEKLEKLKMERRNAPEADILSRSKSQSKTDENYMDYYQESSGQTNPDFERKSYYQWQWHQMQKTEKQYFEEIK